MNFFDEMRLDFRMKVDVKASQLSNENHLYELRSTSIAVLPTQMELSTTQQLAALMKNDTKPVALVMEGGFAFILSDGTASSEAQIFYVGSDEPNESQKSTIEKIESALTRHLFPEGYEKIVNEIGDVEIVVVPAAAKKRKKKVEVVEEIVEVVVVNDETEVE